MIRELARQRINVSLDEEPDHAASVTSLDLDRLRKDFFKFTGEELTEQKMLGLKLLSGDRDNPVPTLGGLLIAGTVNPLEYARIKCARFKGMDAKEFIDRKEFSGPLYTQVENTLAFARVYIPRAGKVEGVQRIDTDAVPLEAVREAVVNAVVHRDYSISGSDIKFAVFDNRIEITSPGALPKSLVIEDIVSGRSEIRNRVIARFFRQINFIEQWGTGIGKILSLCRERHLKAPDFIESGLFFKVIIYSESAVKSSQKSSQKILEMLAGNSHITIKKMAAELGVSDRAVKKQIKGLKDEGRLRRVGPDRGGYWQIMEK